MKQEFNATNMSSRLKCRSPTEYLRRPIKSKVRFFFFEGSAFCVDRELSRHTLLVVTKTEGVGNGPEKKSGHV
jgi:hypothetical protein